MVLAPLVLKVLGVSLESRGLTVSQEPQDQQALKGLAGHQDQMGSPAPRDSKDHKVLEDQTDQSEQQDHRVAQDLTARMVLWVHQVPQDPLEV